MRRSSPLTLAIIVLVMFTVVTSRLAWLMLVEGERLSAEAAQQQTRSMDYYQYGRGDILDRYGRDFTGVAENCLVVFPAMVDDHQRVAEVLSSLLGVEQTVVAARLSA